MTSTCLYDQYLKAYSYVLLQGGVAGWRIHYMRSIDCCWGTQHQRKLNAFRVLYV